MNISQFLEEGTSLRKDAPKQANYEELTYPTKETTLYENNLTKKAGIL
jgi:hypothetical protein